MISGLTIGSCCLKVSGSWASRDLDCDWDDEETEQCKHGGILAGVLIVDRAQLFTGD